MRGRCEVVWWCVCVCMCGVRYVRGGVVVYVCVCLRCEVGVRWCMCMCVCEV